MGKLRQRTMPTLADFIRPECQPKCASVRDNGVCADCGRQVRLPSGTWNVTRLPGRPHTRPNKRKRRRR